MSNDRIKVLSYVGVCIVVGGAYVGFIKFQKSESKRFHDALLDQYTLLRTQETPVKESEGDGTTV